MIATPHSIMLNDPRYGGLDDTEKRNVEARLAAMQRIDAAANKAAALAAEAARLHAGRQLSEGALRKMYYEKWRDGGRKWAALINRARVKEAAARGVPAAAVAHWHALCYRFRGKHAAAHRALVREWQERQHNPGVPAIPGYETAPWAPELPAGLSYENLMRRKYRPSPYADKVASIGISAGLDLVPGVLSTRAGLAFGARYVFDDIWHDLKVHVPGQMGARRLLQFHCIELLSACQCARGMKPEILNDRTGRMERLKERELLFLLAHVLGNLGYNAAGCGLMMEHGTASVAERVERLLHDLSGGALTVLRGGITGSALAPGLYAGRGKGNFKFKAALESLGNLVHNETADRLALPMQTGSNSRLNEPDELHGQERAHDTLALALLALPAPLRELVRLPATPVHQAIEFCDMVQERMNERSEHALEGWADCGFTISEYRAHPAHAWQPMTQLAELPAPVRAALEAAIATDARLSRPRQLSPREVFDGLAPTLTRLRAHQVPLLLGPELAEERRTAKDGRFVFADADLGPGDHCYEPIVRDDEGHATTLRGGETFATFVSTLDRARLHVCDARGRYLGWCERTQRVTHGDAHAYARAAGRKMTAHRALLAPVLAAARPILKAQTDAAEANAAIFEHAAGAPAALPPKPARRAHAGHARRAEQLAAAAEAQRSDPLSPP